MAEIKELTKLVCDFRDAREWKPFHNPKDMALSLLLEASELAEHFQWKNEAECQEHITKNREDIADELSDVLYWALIMAHDMGIDLPSAFKSKMQKNALKYPIEAAKGSAKKYSEL